MTKKLFSLITVIALVSQFLSPWTFVISAKANGEGAVCPNSNVKKNIGETGYENTDGSATISGDEYIVHWSPAAGYEVTEVCVKIGGPGGGSLKHPDPAAGQAGPYGHGISHVVVTTMLIQPVCGDGIINQSWEQCELPNTPNNENCEQTTSECLGNKSGTRDLFGDCNVCCGCAEDPFNYQCVVGACGADCAVDKDCDDGNQWTTDICNLDACTCEYEEIPHCGDGNVVPPEQCELPGTSNNTFCPQETTQCEGNKLGTRDEHGNCDEFCGCTEDLFNYQCVVGSCDAQCVVDADCDDEDVHTIDTCNVDTCACDHKYVPYCGDGVVDPGEDCDGDDLDGKTCEGLDFDGGTLVCTPDCTFDTDLCYYYGSISGKKFNDLNGNHVRTNSTTDPNLPGWTIRLDKDGPGNVPNCPAGIEDGEYCKVQTNASGNYSFLELEPGTYIVSEVLIEGWTQTRPNKSYGGLGRQANGTYLLIIESGSDIDDRDFGNFENIDVTVCKKIDVNGDGDISGDPFYTEVGGWEVSLNENTQKTVEGCYVFEDVGPGTYSVTESIYGGWTQTYPSFPFYYDFDAVSGQDKTFNFGNFQLGLISGHKYNDLSNDGNWDSGEPKLAGWTIFLDENSNGIRDGGEIFRVTDVDGYYEFTKLGPGTYIVAEELQYGWAQTDPTSDDSSIGGKDNGTYEVEMTSGGNFEGRDFGNRGDLSICGTKYNDLNGNGIYDSGEPGIGNWQILLSGTSDTGRIINESISTNICEPVGEYCFENLEPGDYTVTEETRDGWTATSASFVPFLGMTEDQIADFFNFECATILGMKWEDTNGNGKKDNGELGLEGWTINLFGPENSVTKTSSDGTYFFTVCAAGEYTVSETIPDADIWYQTYPGGIYTVNVESGAISEKNNFGNAKYGKIFGFKYRDNDGDGNLDPEDVIDTLAGWTIELHDASTGVLIDTYTTFADGYYEFTHLLAGTTYYLLEQIKPGWVQTVVPDYEITIKSGTISEDNNFGNFEKVTLSGFKFNDLNGNGIWDEGEYPLEDWTIFLDENSNGIRDGGEIFRVTDGDGYYEFTDLGPGSYSLTEEGQTGWKQTVGPDPVTVYSGENVSELNFGNRGDLSICGTKYNDADESGTLTDGDLLIEDWTITLSGDRSETVMTDGEGYYCFNYLEPGDYTVAEETRDGWTAISAILFSFTGMVESQTADFFNYPYPVLEIEKVSDVVTFINPGYTVTYTITIENTGVGPAVDFEVQDVLPSGFSYVDGSSIISGATGSGPVVSGNTLVWTIEKLESGSSFTITYEVLTASDIAAGSYINTASVMGKSHDCEVEVRISRVLAAATEKDLPAKIGKVLGAATGSPIVTLILMSFVLASGLYFGNFSRRKRQEQILKPI